MFEASRVNREEVEAVKLEVKHLEYHNISTKRVLATSIRYLMERSETEESPQEFLLAARARLQAYVEMGFPYEDHTEIFDKLLSRLGTERIFEFPRRAYGTKRIALTRPQVDRLIGRWPGSKYHTMARADVVDDIIDKVTNKREGRYEYHSNANPNTGRRGDEVYILFVDPGESYFYDTARRVYYTFIEP